jgi:hypothetical protein
MYFPFTGEAYKPQVGLSPLDLKNWIEPGPDFEFQMNLKNRLLRDEADTVLQAQPEAEAGIFDLYETLQAHLLETDPTSYRKQNDEFICLRTRESFTRPEEASVALHQIGHWVQEDFAVLSPTPPVKLIAGCVCFPSRWSLKDKIGKDSDGIHVPVPKFATTIAKPTANFLERVSVERPMLRYNWTLHDNDHLFCPKPDIPREDITVENVIQETYLRIERQTLRRLAKSQFVVFTIRTSVGALAPLLEEPENLRKALATLETLPPETANYKGMRLFYPQLLTALRQRL